MSFLNDRNMSLDKKLAEADQLISQKEAQIKQLSNEVKNNQKIKKLGIQIAEIQKIKEDMEKQILVLNQNINQLMSSNDELNLTIATLKNENNALAENINVLKAISVDAFFNN